MVILPEEIAYVLNEIVENNGYTYTIEIAFYSEMNPMLYNFFLPISMLHRRTWNLI